jgi:hypothetical protein
VAASANQRRTGEADPVCRVRGWEAKKHQTLFSPKSTGCADFAPGAEVGSIAQEHCDAEKPPWGGGFVSFGSTCSAVSATNLYGQGFGEFEAEGGLGGQDDLLVPRVCRSCGSRTGTHC